MKSIFFLITILFASSAFSNQNCSELNIAKQRKEFQTGYDQKDFKSAFSKLNSFISTCQNKIPMNKLLWLQNDLLLTAIKLGDWGACRRISDNIAENAKNASPTFQRAYKNTNAYCSLDYYFNGIKLVNTLPQAATAINKLSSAEALEIVTQIKNSNPSPAIDDNYFTVYKGNFSNQGNTEYAFIRTEGSMNVDTVRIFKVVDKKIIEIPIENMIEKNLHTEMQNFYYWVGRPFAFIKDNKTYLRFMDFPGGHTDYDLLALGSCTYLLNGDKIALAGPNFKFAKQSKFPLIAKGDCIGVKK